MNEEYVLFLEESLESLPFIYTKLKQLSNHYSFDLLSELEEIVNQLATKAQQEQLIEIKNCLKKIELLNSFSQESQTPNQKSNLIKQLWQAYTNFKQYLIKNLSQSDSGKAGILAQGESFVGLISPLIQVSEIELFQEIWHKDVTPILNYLETAHNNSNQEQLTPIFHQQAEILLGLGELLEIADLITITQIASALQQSYPQATHLIVKRTLASWRTAQDAYFQLLNPNLELEEENKIDLFDNAEIIDETASITITKPLLHRLEKYPKTSTINTTNFLLWLAGTNLFLLPAEQIQEIVNLFPEQIIDSHEQIFFNWQAQLIPCLQLSQLIKYNYYPLNRVSNNSTTSSLSQIVILKQNQKFLAVEIEVEQLLVIPELTLQHFNPILTTPTYLLGCTVLENERLFAIIEVLNLLANHF
ncbi:chemotaxis response regulator [Stanieria sp. NIES-3757]|nr:chemotaxis response regulator [Stanieria sp. NIES-3757]